MQCFVTGRVTFANLLELLGEQERQQMEKDFAKFKELFNMYKWNPLWTSPGCIKEFAFFGV